MGNHKPQDGYLNQSLRFQVWTPYLPAVKVQNVFMICLLMLPLTCGMHETHLKPVKLHHKQCAYDAITLLHYFWYYPGVWVKLEIAVQGKLCLWNVNYRFYQTLWQIIFHTLFQALMYAWMCVCVCVCACVRAHVCMCVRMYIWCMYVCIIHAGVGVAGDRISPKTSLNSPIRRYGSIG